LCRLYQFPGIFLVLLSFKLILAWFHEPEHLGIMLLQFVTGVWEEIVAGVIRLGGLGEGLKRIG